MAQTQQIRMSLMFDANTSKAKASLRDLQTSLNSLTNSIAAGDFPMTGQIQEAYVAAEKLKTALNSAVNIQTGKFDIIKFNTQLKQSGLSAAELGAKFAGAGAAGAQAFAQLASTIAQAEIPTKRMGHLVDKMAQSLKQTLQWQLSSSVIHGITGALSSAYGYAQDLNKSLTDIRIVTGEGAEFMSDFAREANKSAKALSATTNEYAKASLIFYQQGLGDEDVQKRTDAVIKMANVTGESAQEISSYMTAIWNNFDDGTKSLEYYADAMTALGAATASSTEEIATGMQQFASVAETVGLSYEYAASALATVVSATRQSEETVGTSFKTIFARLSSLSLGETLEDGTNLTKYSQALAKVGVDIKDQQGELKDMDQILDELGAKWSAISKEQQTALAYTVAGSRQYNNFISLLDNYEEFKINVDLAVDAEGTLNKQQEIYAEGWEAAADRARAAAESIFEKLINDDFFIDLLNGLEKFLNGLDRFIDAIGGLPGVLGMISTIMMKVFGSQMTEGIRNLTYNVETFLGISAKKAQKIKDEYLKMATEKIDEVEADVVSNGALKEELEMLKQKVNLELTYLQHEDELSEKQKQEYKYELQLLEVLRQQTAEKKKRAEEAENRTREVAIEAFGSYSQVDDEEFKKRRNKKHVDAVVDAQQELTYVHQEQNVADEQVASLSGDLAKAEARLQATLDATQKALPAHHGYTGIQQDKKTGQYSIAPGGITSEVPSAAAAEINALVERIAKLREGLQAATEWTHKLAEQEAEAVAGVQTAEETARIAAQDTTAPMGPIDAKQELDRYLNYTSGKADISQGQLLELIKQYQNIGSIDTNTDEGKEAVTRLGDELDLFITNFSTELDQSIIEVASKMKEGLMEGAEERPDAATLTSEAEAAHVAAKEKYDQSNPVDENDKRRSSERIRDKMRDEVGAEFSDEAFVKINEALEEQTKLYKSAQKSGKKYGDQLTKTTANLKKKAKKDLPDVAAKFTELSAGISGVATAFSALSGIFDTWENKDLSFGEKLLSTFMSLGTAVPMLVSSFNSFNKVFGITNGLQALSNNLTNSSLIIQAAKLGLTWKDIAAMEAADIQKAFHISLQEAENLAIIAKTALIGKELGMMTAEQIAEKTGMTIDQAKLVLSKMQTGATLAEALAEAGLTTAKGTGIAATIAQTIANIALQASMAPVLVVTLAIIAALAILAIGIMAVVGVVMLLVSAFQAWKASKPDAVLADAQAQAERLGESLKKAREEADGLREAIEKYDTAIDKVKGLVQGTDEYRAAVAEANAAARELIDTYDGLEYTFNSATGLIEIDEESLETVQEKANNKVSQAEIDYLTGQNQVKNAEKANKAYELSREDAKERRSQAATTALIVGEIAALIPGIGWGITAAISAANAGIAIAGEIQDKQQEKGLNALFEAYTENNQDFNTAFNTLSASQQKAIEALGMTDDELAQLCAEMHNNTIAVIENNKQIAASMMAGDENFDESDAKNTATAMAAKDISNRAQELFESTYKDGAGMWDIDAQKAYAEAMGWDPNLVKNKNGNKAVYINEEGEEVTISDETARRFLAEQAAQKEAEGKTDEYVKKAEEAVATIKRYGTGLTAGQADTIAADIATGKTANLTGLTPSQIAQIKAYTEGAADEFSQGLYEGAQEAERLWKESLDGLSTTARDMIDGTEDKQGIADTNVLLSQQELVNYGKSIETVASSFGAETATKYADTINQLMAENKDEASEISAIASGIDWTNGEQGLRDLQGQLSEIGVYIDEDITTWEAFAEAMENTNISVLKYEFETMRTQLAEIGELTSGVEFGNIVSDEDYQNLIKYNGALAEQFQITADGYRYIGEGDLADQSESMAEDMLQDMLDNNARAKAGVNASSKQLEYNYAKEHGIVDDDLRYIASEDNGQWDSTLEALGYDKEELGKLAEQLNSEDEDIRKAAEEKAKQFYQDVDALEAKVANGEFDDAKAYGMYATTLDSVEELEAKKTKFDEAGQSEVYERQLQYLKNRAKLWEEEIDRYQDENAAIEGINKAISEKARISEEAYGPTKKKALEEEIELTKQLQAANEAAVEQANLQVQEEIAKLNDELGLELEFDENGMVTNWEALEGAAAHMTEAERERFFELKDSIQDAQSKVEDYTEAAIESQDAIIDKQLEASRITRDLNDEIRALGETWIDFQKSAIEQDGFTFAENLTLLSRQITDSKTAIKLAWNELRELAEDYGVETKGMSFGDIMRSVEAASGNSSRIKERLDEIGDVYLTEMENLAALDSELADSLVKHFEDVSAVYDNAANQLSFLNSTLSAYRNIIDLVGEDTLGLNDEIFAQMNKAEQDAAETQLHISKNKYDQLKKDREYAEEMLANSIEGTDNAAYWKEQLQSIQEMEQEALEEMNDNWAAALEKAAETLENSTSRILKSFEESMTGIYGSFDKMQEVYDQQSTINSQYLADYKKVYELTKLTRNIENSIDNTENVAAKQSLKELQAEITELQASGTEMSEYDLEYLQKKYDLRLAEIALEEAQNAKNQVRLQKMSNGSWGYVYTQNAQAVDKAEQNYQDKLYELQNLSTSYLEETSAAILSTQADFNAAYEEIMNDTSLSVEQKKAEIDELVKYYEKILSYFGGEYDKVINNNQGVENMVQNLSETTLGGLYAGMGYETASDIVEGWTEGIGSWDDPNSLLGQSGTALNDYATSLAYIFEAAGTSMGEFGEKVVETADEVTQGALDAMNKISELEVENAELQIFDTLLATIKGKRDELLTEYDKIKNDYESWAAYMYENEWIYVGASGNRNNTISQILKGQKETGRNLWTSEELYSMTDELLARAWNEAGALDIVKASGTGGSWNSKNFDGFTRSETIHMFETLRAAGYSLAMPAGKTDFEDFTDEELKTYMEQLIGLSIVDANVFKQELGGNWAAFNTGGYTGEWGPEGRLAVLHEKEIVLNEADTQNLLHTIEIMDRLIKNIELQALSAAFDSLTAPSIHTSGDTLQQEVTIHAEFPNATNHSEIEQAFDTLINRASQYANRNR